jgi:peptide/nickel transport system substrate-binding protein
MAVRLAEAVVSYGWEKPIEPLVTNDVARRRRRAAKRRQRRRRAGLALLGLAALLALIGLAVGLASGGGSAGGGSAGRPGTGPPRAGGTLTVAFDGEPASLDPAVAMGTEAQSIVRLTYQTLLTYASEPGAKGTTLVPDLATEVPSVANGGISNGGKVYTFHLKSQARFAPPVNAAVTAADVKWSLERMLRQPLAPATFFYAGIAGAQAYLDDTASSVSGLKVVDPATIQVTLEKPDAAFLSTMAMPFASVMSKAWCAKVGTQIDHRPLGSGPYIIKSWTRGQRIDVVKNPDFSSQGTKDGQWLDGMRFIFTPSSQALLKLERGEIDVLGEGVPHTAYEATRQSSEWGKYVVDAPQIAWQYLFMNVQAGQFRSVRVRRAVNYAVDTRKIVDLLGGDGQQLSQIYPVGLPGHQADRQDHAPDPDKAKQLLAAAGYPHGFTTSLYASSVDPQPRIAEALRSDLAAVGIKAEVHTLDPASYWAFISLKGSKVPLGLANWYQDYPDPSDWIGPLFDNPVDGGADFAFYQKSRLTKLLEESAGQLDGAKRLSLFERMQDIVMGDAPVVPLFQPVWHGLAGKNVGGYYVHPVWTFDFQHYWKTDGR